LKGVVKSAGFGVRFEREKPDFLSIGLSYPNQFHVAGQLLIKFCHSLLGTVYHSYSIGFCFFDYFDSNAGTTIRQVEVFLIDD